MASAPCPRIMFPPSSEEAKGLIGAITPVLALSREVSDLSGCPVKSLTCTNSPDTSKCRCPGCPVTAGLHHPGVLQPVGEADLSLGAGAGGDFLLRTICDTGGHHTLLAIKEPAGQNRFASRTLIVLRSRVRRFESCRGHPL